MPTEEGCIGVGIDILIELVLRKSVLGQSAGEREVLVRLVSCNYTSATSSPSRSHEIAAHRGIKAGDWRLSATLTLTPTLTSRNVCLEEKKIRKWYIREDYNRSSYYSESTAHVRVGVCSIMVASFHPSSFLSFFAFPKATSNPSEGSTPTPRNVLYLARPNST